MKKSILSGRKYRFINEKSISGVMLAAETELKKAQKVKEYLNRHSLVNPDYLIVKELGLIYFPLNKKVKVPGARVLNTKFDFPKKKKPLEVENVLRGKLTPEEQALLPKSQETVGSILILEIPPELEPKEKIIAEAYLKSNKALTTIVKKDEIHSGVYRTRTVKVLAGKNTKETIHTENGVKLKIDLEKTYFSAKSGHERLRVAEQVKKGELVLVMFSGAAPYPLVIARNSPAKMVYAVELNPLAHQLAVQNITSNHLEEKIVLYLGDARKVVPKLKKKFDRIAMPLPKTGEEFLDVTLKASHKGTIIHLYAFLAEEEIPKDKKRIKALCKNLGYNVKILRAVKCGQFSPRIFRVCFDMGVE